MKKEYWIFNDELKIKMKVKTDNINHYTSNILSSYFTLNRRPALINRIFIIGLANNKINLSKTDKFEDYLHIDPLEKHKKIERIINKIFKSIKPELIIINNNIDDEFYELGYDYILNGYNFYINTDKKICNNKVKNRLYTKLRSSKDFYKKYYRSKYETYMDSDEWRIKRNEMIKKYKCCQVCSSVSNLHCHHLTYDNLFNEKEEDLVILCSICHKEEHNKISKSGYTISEYYKNSNLLK
jgi:hypothetical protein